MKRSARNVLERFDKLHGAQGNWRALWDECLYYCLPEQVVLEPSMRPKSSDGEPRSAVEDTTAVYAAERLGAGLFSNTIAMGQEWFRLVPRTPVGESPNSEHLRWFSIVGKIALRKMQESNLPQAAQEALHLGAVLGTGALHSELMDDRAFRFTNIPIHSSAMAADPAGRVLEFHRRMRMTARELLSEFGPDLAGRDLPRRLLECKGSEAKLDEVFEVVHAVYRRDDGDWDNRSEWAADWKWASEYILRDEAFLLRGGGFKAFPYAVFRFYSVPGECYGRSPAMRALPAMRLLNRAAADHIAGMEMAIFPPLFTSDPRYKHYSLKPGAVNPIALGHEPPRPYETRYEKDAMEQLLLRYGRMVERMFYVDLFDTLSDQPRPGGGPMTATEVEERVAERIQALSPVVSRLQSELFSPLVERVVMQLWDGGLLPEPPAGLPSPAAFEVVYSTRIAAKLAQVEVQNLRNAVMLGHEASMAVAEVRDDLLPLYDPRVIARRIAEAYNVPPSMFRSRSEEKQVAEQLAEEARARAEIEAAAALQRPIDAQKTPEPGSLQDKRERG